MSGSISRRAWIGIGASVLLAPVLAACGATGAPSGIYVVPVNGAPRWIGAGEGAPAWSPDGTALAWGDETGLWVSSLGDSPPARIVESRVVARPAWAPDGSAIAFVDAPSATLQRVAPDGANLVPLATIAADATGVAPPLMQRGGPAWSPDGKTITFVCWDGGGDELCLVDAEGRRRQEITALGKRGVTPAGSSVIGMAWSPDSTQIAVGVQAEQSGATAGVFLIELTARTGRRISTLVPNSPMSWPAASGGILFSATRDGRSDAFALDPVTKDAQPLTAALADGAHEPALSDQGSLAVVQGNTLALVNGDAAQSLPPGPLAVSAPAWNPAGDALAVLASATPIQKYR